MIPRFFAPVGLAADALVVLDPAAAHHAVRVLRLGAGDAVELFDGDGHAAHAAITAVAPCTARVTALLPASSVAAPRLTLAQCISSADKMDWTLEKAVELGVSRIVPLQSRKAIVRLDAARSARRREHWQRLIIAACAQSGQNRLPRLDDIASLEPWLRGAGAGDAGVMRLVLAPDAHRSLAAILDGCPPVLPREVWLLCGPEAGFADEELAAAVAAGWTPAGLGPRVLRTETAGLAALVVVQSRWGELR